MVPIEVVMARQKARINAFDPRQHAEEQHPGPRRAYGRKGPERRSAGTAPCWTPDEDDLVSKFYHESGALMLAEILGRTVKAIQLRASALGVARRF